MKFVVDGMLGGLARWLRMLGYTVMYDHRATDNALLSTAASQRMILLTRDEELHWRATARELQSLLVTGSREVERLAEIAKAFHISLDLDMAATKCPGCGGELEKTQKREIAGLVPPMSLGLYSEFWKCASHDCNKVYWKGSHWKRIDQTLAKAKSIAADRE